MKTSNFFSEFNKEFDSAVLHAYLGPRVEDGEIPMAFECEERIPSTDDGAHPHILELTSGQQVLGWVVEAHSSLRVGAAASQTDGQQRQGCKGDERNATLLHHYWDGLARVEASNYISLDLVWGDKTIARGVRAVEPTTGDDMILIQTQVEDGPSSGEVKVK